MGLLAATFGLSVASALLPFINIEVYLAAVATQVGTAGALTLAVAAGIGQTIGKLVWYYATRRGMDSAWMRKKLEKPKAKASLEKWQARADGRPWFMGTIIFLAASVGVPPMLVMAAVAGTVRMNVTIFVVTCLVGRTIRFWVILAGVGWLWF
ncbi:VTT domain-containing protein [Nocardioides sp. AE5]|uniref:VTT domain-containing protein n=1 Tax=Nocardioides sp. AE5 TaxID=2962573 RepID=UPI0028814162|nr:VTT domain-containing protein [Nocardioides sp. AE5]MDT0201045.1 VTT domain-containing protein [Nocardioides sp. AE5]